MLIWNDFMDQQWVKDLGSTTHPNQNIASDKGVDVLCSCTNAGTDEAAGLATDYEISTTQNITDASD